VFLDLVTATAGDPNNNNNTNTNNNTMSLTLANSGTTAFNDANAAFPRRDHRDCRRDPGRRSAGLNGRRRAAGSHGPPTRADVVSSPWTGARMPCGAST